MRCPPWPESCRGNFLQLPTNHGSCWKWQELTWNATDTTGGAAWTVYASITFQNEEDANYFAHEDPANQEVKAKNKEMNAGFCVIQGSFT
ncbi:hypothetical protein F4801DRAFT_572438 [Xylaria longipes]|nr:hypothetical protein F4801DRAFT_572438 [Xylaria longipes]